MLKLNLGCGTIKLEGYINIDVHQTKAADLVADVRKLSFAKDTVDEIIGYHIIEHMTLNDGLRAVLHWYNLLKKGGKLILEWPDLQAICKNVGNGNIDDIVHIYGLNRYAYDTHQWGYTDKTMKELLEKVGFNSVIISKGTDYHTQQCPCLRVEGVK